MVQSSGRERAFPSLHNVLRMLLSNSPSKPGHESNELPEEAEEPPDHRADDGVVYLKSSNINRDPGESLLTRALKSNSPELSPSDHNTPLTPADHSLPYRSYPHNGGLQSGELTSDGGLPSLSNSPSPPASSRLAGLHLSNPQKPTTADTSESNVPPNPAPRRCVTFAGAAQTKKPQQAPPASNKSDSEKPPTPETPKRKTTISFACPTRESDTQRERSPRRRSSLKSRPCGSPAPTTRRSSLTQPTPTSTRSSKDPESATTPPPPPQPKAAPPTITAPQPKERRGIPTSGLGSFEASEETRFHEFASSVEEDPDWVLKEPAHPHKITLNDCLEKEFAIRKLGEEAEEEAEDDEDDDDEYIDDETVHYFSSDDEGNESDNEAGFADSDDSDNGSDSGLWAPVVTATPTRNPGLLRPNTTSHRGSYTSAESANESKSKRVSLMPPQRHDGPHTKPIKMRPGTPNLPDSTDFVCGTLDEDRPLEAAYKACMEQRRLLKQIPIPQDIDPSFPTSDLDDENDKSGGLSDDEEEELVHDDDNNRGRSARGSEQSSPHRPQKRLHSPPPKRLHSPPPKASRSSPKRLRSPAPRRKGRSPPPPTSFGVQSSIGDSVQHDQIGFNISGLVQRPTGITRTKSLPRTPNPFFFGLDRSMRLEESPARDQSRSREGHTRGPVDIVEGLERKRQKRKEKFWRQHCRKAAKEEKERRPIPGKGAERMRELGLEAERCRAYGVGHDAGLVISV